MGFILGKLGLGKIQLFIMVGLAIALVAAGWALKNQIAANGRMVEQVKVAAAAVEEQRREAAEMRAKYEDQLARLNILQLENKEIRRDRDHAVRTLDDFRARLGKAGKGKPGLVGDRATRATRRLMCQFYETTGGQGPCGDRKGAP